MIYGTEGIGEGISSAMTVLLVITLISFVGTVFGMYAVGFSLARDKAKTALWLGIVAFSMGLAIFCLLGFPLRELGLNMVTAMILVPGVLGSIAAGASFIRQMASR